MTASRTASPRERILDAAALEIVQSGYAGSSLSAIAGRLGLTKGALSRQFPTKDSLIDEIVQMLGIVLEQEHERSIDVYRRSGIRALVRFMVSVGYRLSVEPPLAAGVVLFSDRGVPDRPISELFDIWRRVLTDFLVHAQHTGEIPLSTPVEQSAEFLLVSSLGKPILMYRAPTLPVDPAIQFNFLRVALRACGAGEDEIESSIVDVMETLGAGSIPSMPNRDIFRRSTAPLRKGTPPTFSE